MQCLASATSSQARRAICRGAPAPFKSAGLPRRYARAPVRVNALHLPELHDAAASAFIAASHTAQVVYTVAEESGGGGPVDWLANGFEGILKVLNGALETAGVPYTYGFAIILLTILVKIATYPLSQKQVESTLALQALQPQVKELQAKFANNPEQLQLETARLYREAGVNPLAGCLPTLATIPVFIGLYRALTKAAEENLLTDPFFWIPSLGGPASLAAQKDGTGLAWLFPLQDGAPPIGWHDAGAYLVLPVLLVVSQYVTQKLVSPPQQSNDPAAQSTQAILKFLPLMIGWFSLNVPAGLTLYWFVNNILSTAQQLYLKSSVKPLAGAASASGASPVITRTPTGTIIDVPSSSVVDVKPRESREEKVKKPSGKEMGSRKKKGDKFRALKAREAAQKAASQVETNGTATQTEAKAASSATATQEAPELRVPDAPPAKDNSSA